MSSTALDVDAFVRPPAIGALLADRLGDPRWCDVSARLISGGKSNLTFHLSSTAGEVILRRPPVGELLPSAHDMRREARIQKALAGTIVPVPAVLVEDDGDVLGVPFYVMSLVPGHVIRDRLPDGYAESAEDKKRLVAALVDVLADLHQLEPQQLGLGDYGRPEGFMKRQLRRWTEQWHRSRTGDISAVERLARGLAHRMPSSQPVGIVHGDYRLDNCIMDPDDPGKVAAVLDWELSTLGNPLSDLGLLLFYWREPGEPQRKLTPTATVTPGFPSRDYLVERYAVRSRIPVQDISFYLAFAHYKFAIVAQGIAARVAAGAMAGQDFGDLEEEVRTIAIEGLNVLEREN